MMGPQHVTKRGAVASSRSDGKRKWSDHRNRDVTIGSRSASSSCRSDCYMGVRNRGFTVEIRRWCEGQDFYKDVKMSEGEAAVVHDLARLYLDRTSERLNIKTLESRMQEEDPALTGFGERLHIGKEFLTSFVESHPLAQAGSTPKERVDSMKEAIIALAPEAFKGLKKEIANKLSRAGCYRKETDEFFPAVEDNYPLDDSKKEIKRLVSQIASLEVTQAAELKAKDAELMTKDAQIASLQEDLRTAQSFIRLPSPTSGLM